MPAITPRIRNAMLVVTGMVLLLAGVIAGAAVGNLLASDSARGTPLRIGLPNDTAGAATRIVGDGAAAAFEVAQQGDGPALKVTSVAGPAGRFETRGANRHGIYVRNTSSDPGTGTAITALGGSNIGIHATSGASIAVWAESSDLAALAAGNVLITGDLSVGGTCLGCRLAVLAVNGSDVALGQGQAVALRGVSKDDTGNLLVVVGLAGPGDAAIGIADTSMIQQTQRVPGSKTLIRYLSSTAVMTPSSVLRVITNGVIEFVYADLANGEIAAGDELMAGDTPGTLTRAPAESQSVRSIGYALGPVANGFVPIFLSPS